MGSAQRTLCKGACVQRGGGGEKDAAEHPDGRRGFVGVAVPNQKGWGALKA